MPWVLLRSVTHWKLIDQRPDAREMYDMMRTTEGD